MARWHCLSFPPTLIPSLSLPAYILAPQWTRYQQHTECTHCPKRLRGEEAGKCFLISQRSFQARVRDTRPAHSTLRPVCHGSPHSSQGSLLPQCQSPLPASAHPAFHTAIKLSQSTGLETGADRKKSEGSKEFRGEEAASEAALPFPVKLVGRLVG